MDNLAVLKKIINDIKAEEFFYTLESYNYELTGDYFSFTWLDLVYLLMEVKKQFGITIIENDVLNYKFNSVNGILSVINKGD